MIHKKTKIAKRAALLGTVMLFTVSPASAGFEWTPPAAPEKVMMAPAEPATPDKPLIINEEQIGQIMDRIRDVLKDIK